MLLKTSLSTQSWGARGLKVTSVIAKVGAPRSGLGAGLLKRQYLEGLSVAIRRAVAKAILQRGVATVVDTVGCHGLLEGDYA